MRRAFSRTAALLAAVAIGGTWVGRGAAEPPPERQEPNLRTRAPSDFRIEVTDVAEGPAVDERPVVRFTNTVTNEGEGPLLLVQGNQPGDVLQRLFYEDGSFVDRKAGTFELHPEHNHYHFENFARYLLCSSDGRNDKAFSDDVGSIIRSSEKVTFCIIDTLKLKRFAGPGQPSQAQFRFCGLDTQGISVGWGDEYHASLFDQWIVIDGVADEVYWIVSEVDPANQLEETNESDGFGAALVEISQGGTRVRKIR